MSVVNLDFKTKRKEKLSNLVSEESALPIALLLSLEPIRVSLGPGVDEGRAFGLVRVVVPVRDLLLAGT
jgi:hypothetical protein